MAHLPVLSGFLPLFHAHERQHGRQRLAAEAVRASEWTPEDFFIFTATGTEDFAGAAFTMQIDSMATRYGDVFRLADNERDGNLSFCLREGGTHGGRDAMDDSLEGLCWFWHDD